MIKDCAHLNTEYLDTGEGYINWQCLDCGEVLEDFQDCTGG
jgi:hypothetical protein